MLSSVNRSNMKVECIGYCPESHFIVACCMERASSPKKVDKRINYKAQWQQRIPTTCHRMGIWMNLDEPGSDEFGQCEELCADNAVMFVPIISPPYSDHYCTIDMHVPAYSLATYVTDSHSNDLPGERGGLPIFQDNGFIVAMGSQGYVRLWLVNSDLEEVQCIISHEIRGLDVLNCVLLPLSITNDNSYSNCSVEEGGPLCMMMVHALDLEKQQGCVQIFSLHAKQSSSVPFWLSNATETKKDGVRASVVAKEGFELLNRYELSGVSYGAYELCCMKLVYPNMLIALYKNNKILCWEYLNSGVVWTEITVKAEGTYFIANLWSDNDIKNKLGATLQDHSYSSMHYNSDSLLCHSVAMPLTTAMSAATGDRSTVLHSCVYLTSIEKGSPVSDDVGVVIIVTATRCVVSSFPDTGLFQFNAPHDREQDMGTGASTLSDVSIVDCFVQQIKGGKDAIRFTLTYVSSYEKSLVSKVYVIPSNRGDHHPLPQDKRIEYSPYSLDGIRDALEKGIETHANGIAESSSKLLLEESKSLRPPSDALSTSNTPPSHHINADKPSYVLDADDAFESSGGVGDCEGFSFFHKMGKVIATSSPLYCAPLDPPPTAPIYKGANFSDRSASKSKQHSWEAPQGVNKNGKVSNQPVTFHTRIKSSGYGQSSKSDHDKWLMKQKKLKAAAALKSKKSNSNTADVSAVAMGLVNRENRSHTAPNDGVHRPAHMGKLTLYSADTDVQSSTERGVEQSGSPRGAQSNTNSGSKAGVKVRRYPKNCGLIAKYQPNNDYPTVLGIRPTGGVLGSGSSIDQMQRPVRNIQFNSDASLLAIQYIDNTFSTVKLPTTRYSTSVGATGAGSVPGINHYCGHDANSQITSIHLSNGDNAICSSATDSTVKVWRVGKTETSVINITHTLGNPNTSSSCKGVSGNASRNRPLVGDITAARFYYMDRFIAVGCKNVLRLYTYDTTTTNPTVSTGKSKSQGNDLKRIYNDLNSSGKYKCVYACDHNASLETGTGGGGSNITTFNAVNSVASPIVISATCDRKLNVIDMNVGKIAMSTTPADSMPHDRAIHTIAVPNPSIHTTSFIAPQAYTMFVTSATDNIIAFYDVRDPQYCVGRYGAHVNRREAVGCCFSPCLRYLATGSEDKSIRIVDIRGGFRELCKIGNVHRDVTSSVAYSPLFPQLASCSYDGTVKFFTENVT